MPLSNNIVNANNQAAVTLYTVFNGQIHTLQTVVQQYNIF